MAREDPGSDKLRLHRLVEQLPSEQVAAALKYVQYLSADSVILSLLNAPGDDEPYTDEQRERDAEADAELVRGEGISHDEILREFGL